MAENEKTKFVPEPGKCVPWDVKKKDFESIEGNEELVKSEWEKLDGFAYSFIWFWVQR